MLFFICSFPCCALWCCQRVFDITDKHHKLWVYTGHRRKTYLLFCHCTVCPQYVNPTSKDMKPHSIIILPLIFKKRKKKEIYHRGVNF